MLQSILGARQRALILVLAALMAVGALVGGATPVAATGGACGNWFDNPGTVYDNGDYREAPAANQFWDNWQGKYTRLRADIHSWRYTTTGSDGYGPAGHCLRNVRYSGWVDDGSYGMMDLQARAWVCNNLVYQTGQGYLWEGAHEIWLGWVDYSGCGGPQADTWYTGHNADWTPYYPSDVPAPYINL